MSNLTPAASWDSVIQLEGTMSGVPATWNTPNQALLNRTEWLKTFTVQKDAGGAAFVGATAVITSEKMRIESTGAGSVSMNLRLTNTGATSGTGESLFFTGFTNAGAPCNHAAIYGAAADIAGNGYLAFSTGTAGAATEKMRIDSAGNAGLGVAPSAWAAGGGFVDVPGNGFLGNNANYSSNAMLFGANAYYDTAWKYRSSGLAAAFFQAGNGSFSWHVAPSGTAGAAATFTQAMTLDVNRNLLLTGGGALGYGTGSGGAVTQATSKSTGVTINKPNGHITTHNAALAAGAAVAFLVTNSAMTANDNVVVNLAGGNAGTATYRVWAEGTGLGGQFFIVIENRSGGSLSESLVLHYSIIKGAVS